MNKKILTIVATFMFMSISGLATATVYGPVSPALSGIDAPAGDKNDSAADLNAGNYFDVVGWSELVKVNTPGTTATINGYTLDISSGLLNGTWDFSNGDNPWNDYTSLAIVLKDGKTKPPASGIFWTAWLLPTDTLSGNWEMPLKDLSHMTIYGTNAILPGGDTPSSVPLPASAWLLGSAVFGLFSVFRRRTV